MLAKSVAYLKHVVLGLPLATRQAIEERLSKRVALAVFSSNALSSVAYATEEILLVLVLAGTAAAVFSLPVSLSIVFLVGILTISYCQIIFEYPEGGGAYIVAKSNFGEWAGLAAAASLMIDYVLTVAVSVAAGVAALTSAVPFLFAQREALGVLTVVLMILLNLRGAKESGRILTFPTLLSITMLILMVLVGLFEIFGEAGAPVKQTQALGHIPITTSLTLFLLLRAFSGGCTAVTGMEVISNGVKAFKPPEARNAALTMVAMSLILAFLFLGISVLAFHFNIFPKKEETIISQVAKAIFGEGLFYYFVQAGTMLLLILAANSSFVGFPHLTSILARDQYMPRQMARVGDRLVFSNGIIILGVLAGILIVIFKGETHALIPLYAVGVFFSFTLAQSGMVWRWWKKRGPHWRKKLLVNLIGAVTTGLATAIITSTKFLHGAWVVIVLVPVIILSFRAIHAHYQSFENQLSLKRNHRPLIPKRNIVILPISGVNQAILRALDYARQRSPEVKAVLVDVDREETSHIQAGWAQWGCGVALVTIPSPYRSIVGALLDYIEDVLEKDRDAWVTVVLPEILPSRWWQHILHNQRALLLKAGLLFLERVVVIDVPFHLKK